MKKIVISSALLAIILANPFLTQTLADNAYFEIFTVSSMVKVQRKASLNGQIFTKKTLDKPLELDGARGEYVHGQVVILPLNQDMKGITWSAEPLRGPGENKIPVSIRVVGYLRTKDGLWLPDPLLSHLTSVDVSGGFCQPLWITIEIPRKTTPGIYEGKVHIDGGNIKKTVPVNLRVRQFAIPQTRHLRIANSYEEGIGPMLYKERWNDKLKWQYRQFILDHRLSVHSIYQHNMPMFRHMKDESVEDLKRLREAGQNVFIVMNWQYKYSPDWCKTVDGILDRAHKAGIPDEDLWFYGYDEATEDARPAMIAQAKKIRKRYPKIRIMTTAAIYHPSNHKFDDLGERDELGKLIGAWVPLNMWYERLPDAVAKARARGQEVWWYICNVPSHPYANWFIEYPAIEARLIMGMMAWKYQPDGFLYYSLNRLNWDSPPTNEELIDDGPLCRWNPASAGKSNGDGCLFYYGIDGPVSTIRLENLTDGLEDYEYFWVLRTMINKLKKSTQKKRSILSVPVEVVENLTSFTRDPDKLEQVRTKVADAIESLMNSNTSGQ